MGQWWDKGVIQVGQEKKKAYNRCDYRLSVVAETGLEPATSGL